MATVAEARPLDVLLVEDNDADALLTASAFHGSRVPNRLHVVTDGDAAITFLEKTGIYSNVRRPDLVLLDLRLPKVDGFAVSAAMKAGPQLRSIPVVVLSGSDNKVDLAQADRMHASSYLMKPPNPDQFIASTRAMDLWFETLAVLPKKHEA